MSLATIEECRSWMPSKESRTGPVFSISARSKISLLLTDHILSPPCLLSIYNDISLSVYSNNTIYRYYSHPGKSSNVARNWHMFLNDFKVRGAGGTESGRLGTKP